MTTPKIGRLHQDGLSGSEASLEPKPEWQSRDVGAGRSSGKVAIVTGVAPGPIWTPLNPCGDASDEKLATFGENTPMRHPGHPNEVAPSFLFLACENASCMSGQVIHPNGSTVVNG